MRFAALLPLTALVLSATPVAAQPATVVDDVLAATSAPAAERFWASVEYLVWWNTPMNTPTLIGAVPANLATTNAASGTLLPAGSVQPLFPPGRRFEFGPMNGLRASAGTYFGPDGDWGIDASYFLLETVTKRDSVSNAGQPAAIVQPLTNAATGNLAVLYASLFPNYSGGVTAKADTQTWGADANLRYRTLALIADRNDLLLGFKYLDLQESIKITSASLFPDGSRGQILDVARTHNQFYGGQVGLASRLGPCDRGLGLDTVFKFALGGVRQRAELFGSNTVFAPGFPPDAEAQGLYARGLNAGVFERSITACAVDLATNLTYNFSPRVRVSFGYSLIWLSSVARPGEQLNPAINVSQVRFIANTTPSNVVAPRFEWRANDYWVQGLNVGARLAY